MVELSEATDPIREAQVVDQCMVWRIMEMAIEDVRGVLLALETPLVCKSRLT